jgi:molecular chaperone DnaJ
MAKDYYLILGLASSAGPEDVRAAYRRRAFELHPDQSGGASDPFLDLQEAYSVLRDPEQRRVYDQHRNRHRSRIGSVAEPLRAPGRQTESFRKRQRRVGLEPISLWDDFESYSPGFEEMADRWWGNFQPGSRPKAESIESLTVEVPLSSEQARWGGTVEIRVPVRVVCGLCGGHGTVGHYECWSCQGRGSGVEDRPLRLQYPPGLLGDHDEAIPLNELGIENLYLRVRFRVQDRPQHFTRL